MRRQSFFAIALFSFVLACNNQEKIDSKPSLQAPSAAKVSGLHERQISYADAIERAGSGVVTIRVARRVPSPSAHSARARRSFGSLRGSASAGIQSPTNLESSLGSGVVIRSDGTIVTNYHVINNAQAIRVELVDHRLFDAQVIGSDPPSDLALLKINIKELAAVPLGDSDKVRVGDVALAIGNPLGLGQTVTAGIISAKGRSTGSGGGTFEDFLQTDAPINQGNSGGALINIDGELIGINSQIISNSGGSIGIGFAIPSNMARSVVDQLLTSGRVRRSRLGVAVQSMTPAEAAQLGLSENRGLMILGVAPNSPAARAGMRPGDVIEAFNGNTVTDSNALRNRIANMPPGTAVKLTILRKRRQQNLQVTLGEYQTHDRNG